jgi:hypothetical protein
LKVGHVNVPELKSPLAGTPKAGVTKLGLVANTKAPVPVSSVTAAAKLALLGVAKNVATLVPKPDTPVEIGKPVTLVKVPEAGVPKAGVTSEGLLDKTTLPVPVDVTTPVPPFDTARVPPSVTLPVVAVLGVNPVVPALNDVTPAAAAPNWIKVIDVVPTVIGNGVC